MRWLYKRGFVITPDAWNYTGDEISIDVFKWMFGKLGRHDNPDITNKVISGSSEYWWCVWDYPVCANEETMLCAIEKQDQLLICRLVDHCVRITPRCFEYALELGNIGIITHIVGYTGTVCMTDECSRKVAAHLQGTSVMDKH